MRIAGLPAETAWSFHGASEASKVTRGEPKKGRKTVKSDAVKQGDLLTDLDLHYKMI